MKWDAQAELGRKLKEVAFWLLLQDLQGSEGTVWGGRCLCGVIPTYLTDLRVKKGETRVREEARIKAGRGV